MLLRTQYLPVAGISQTDDERTAREARMSASELGNLQTVMNLSYEIVSIQ